MDIHNPPLPPRRRKIHLFASMALMLGFFPAAYAQYSVTSTSGGGVNNTNSTITGNSTIGVQTAPGAGMGTTNMNGSIDNGVNSTIGSNATTGTNGTAGAGIGSGAGVNAGVGVGATGGGAGAGGAAR